MSELKIISADSHAEEPEYLHDRLPAEYWSRRPHTEELNGLEYFIIDGERPFRSQPPNPMTEEDKRREFRGGEDTGGGFLRSEGGVDIPSRLKDMEEDGVSGEVIYPQGTMKMFSSPSPGFQLALAKVYNDFYIETFGEHQDVFIPSAMVPMVDVEAAAGEAGRVGKLGFRSISVPVSNKSLPYNKPEYDPVWATIAEMGVPLSFHVFTSSDVKEDDKRPLKERIEARDRGDDLSGMVLGMAEAMSPLSLLISAGVLDTHPDLKLVLVECGIGWLAWALYAMDDVFKRRHMWQSPSLEMAPSEYFRRQGYITFGDDPVGLFNRHFTGVDCLMWGSDYPHDEGTWPHSKEVIEETFKDLTAEEKRKIVGENAAALYGFPLN